MISDTQAEAALNFLAETDLLCAELKADMERGEYKLKSLKATVFSMSEGSVADRNAAAEMSGEVRSAWEEHCRAIQDYHSMANQRATKILVIEVWRSINANRRKG